MTITSSWWTEYPWKNELSLQTDRVALHLDEVLDDEFEGEHNPLAMLERAIALAAFSMRRMFEKKLVTDALAARTVSVRSFPAVALGFRPPFHGASGGTAYANYDFSQPETLQLSLRVLANEIMHSSQLMVIGQDEHVADGLLIASDLHLRRRVLHLTREEFRACVKLVLDDRVAVSSEAWDPETDKVTSKRE